jgi:predicted enzyme related to lactoylglutathione lyase
MPQVEFLQIGPFAFFQDPAGNRVKLYKSLSTE